MLRKHGKFFADWRDENGVRHRKACNTAKAARRLQTHKRNEAATKKAQPSGRSANSARRGKPAGRRATTITRRRRTPRASSAASALTK